MCQFLVAIARSERVGITRNGHELALTGIFGVIEEIFKNVKHHLMDIERSKENCSADY